MKTARYGNFHTKYQTIFTTLWYFHFSGNFSGLKYFSNSFMIVHETVFCCFSTGVQLNSPFGKVFHLKCFVDIKVVTILDLLFCQKSDAPFLLVDIG